MITTSMKLLDKISNYGRLYTTSTEFRLRRRETRHTTVSANVSRCCETLTDARMS